jgi:hypothetical protein
MVNPKMERSGQEDGAFAEKYLKIQLTEMT